jgi:small subunit ribosomal protein S7
MHISFPCTRESSSNRLRIRKRKMALNNKHKQNSCPFKLFSSVRMLSGLWRQTNQAIWRSSHRTLVTRSPLPPLPPLPGSSPSSDTKKFDATWEDIIGGAIPQGQTPRKGVFDKHYGQLLSKIDKDREEARAVIAEAAPVVREEDLDIEIPPLADLTLVVPPYVKIPFPEDPLLRLLVGCIMRDGKKARAQKQVSRALQIIHAYTRAPPLPLMRYAIFAVSPAVKNVKVKHPTKTIIKPVALSERRSIRKGIDLLLTYLEGRRIGGPTFEERLAREVIKIITGESAVLNKTAEIHREAMLNRSVSFFPRFVRCWH